MSGPGEFREGFTELPEPMIVGFEGKVAGALRIKAGTIMTPEPVDGSLIHPILVYEFAATPHFVEPISIALLLTESGMRDLGRLTSQATQAALKAARIARASRHE